MIIRKRKSDLKGNNIVRKNSEPLKSSNLQDNNLNTFRMAKDFGEIQYNLILLRLKDYSESEKQQLIQEYWNEFKAILKVSETHAEIMQSKYMPLLFAYKQLFNFNGGQIPKLDGININSDTKDVEKRIVEYLKNLKKGK